MPLTPSCSCVCFFVCFSLHPGKTLNSYTCICLYVWLTFERESKRSFKDLMCGSACCEMHLLTFDWCMDLSVTTWITMMCADLGGIWLAAWEKLNYVMFIFWSWCKRSCYCTLSAIIRVAEHKGPLKNTPISFKTCGEKLQILNVEHLEWSQHIWKMLIVVFCNEHARQTTGGTAHMLTTLWNLRSCWGGLYHHLLVRHACISWDISSEEKCVEGIFL